MGLGRVFLPEESKNLMGLDNLDAAVASQSKEVPVTGDNVLGFRLQGSAQHVVVARVVLEDADSALAGGDDRRLADPLYELGDLVSVKLLVLLDLRPLQDTFEFLQEDR